MDVVEIWRRIQKNWEYLLPMFASKDDERQLPKEAAEFEAINNMWIIVMKVN